MIATLLVLVAIVSGLIGWALGRASIRRRPGAPPRERSSEVEAFPRNAGSGSPNLVHPASTSHELGLNQDGVDVEPRAESTAMALEPNDVGGELKELIASVQANQVEITSRKRRGHIKHLFVTRNGDQWVVDRLPADDYGDFDTAPPTVDELISKPPGYRLVRGYNLLRGDDKEEND